MQAGTPSIEPDIRVGFILSPRFTMLPFAGFLDVLRHAADEADRSRQIYCAWEVVGPTLDSVFSSGGVQIVPQALLGEPARFDCIVVVGGLLPASREHPPETLAFLRQADEANLVIVGLCTGCFTLASAGLLDDRRCAVHFRHAEEFEDLFPDVASTIHEIYVFDRNVATCPGGTAAIDLAVDIISRYSGRARATKGLADLIVDEHRAAFHVPRHPYHDLECCGDERVELAIRLMRQSLSEAGTVKDIARRLRISVSQLNRAFQAHTTHSPAEIWRSMRLQHARWRVLNSGIPLTRIAHECGFADSSHFIRWFRRVYGETPREARRERVAVHEHGGGVAGRRPQAFRHGARPEPSSGMPSRDQVSGTVAGGTRSSRRAAT